ncbi:hypothetical protein C8J57DRAFT_1517983 [Mycena rebaudengoi]|nr:hypothetical protein C8J57DRAFT_1517983 [Mycena rebaudengoi]
MLITNLATVLPHLDKTMVPLLSLALPGELYTDQSNRPGYRYLALHFSWYNWYVEKGHSVPLPSEDMRKHPEEAGILAELIQLITIVVEFHIKKLLPEEYGKIKVYISQLPLNERSTAHPFGGFVINVSVATRGHRDAGDKLFCMVIPFSSWVGGELCLYEPGFVFRLRPWDMIIFPSCDITHFNLHFEGVNGGTHLSLVLHSDKHGDKWVADGNGWVPRDGDDLVIA